MDPNISNTKNWRFFLYKLYEHLENRLQNLRDLKANNYNDTIELLKIEKSLEKIIIILSNIFIILQNEEELEGDFTYTNELLELAHSPNLVKNITFFCHTITIYGGAGDKDILTYTQPFFYFVTPFIRLLHHFGYDYAKMFSEISQNTPKENSDKIIPTYIRELILAIFTDGELVLRIIEQNSLLEAKNQAQFVYFLYTKICEQKNTTKETDKETFFMTIGQAVLVSNLLFPKVFETLFSTIVRMHSFFGNLSILKIDSHF